MQAHIIDVRAKRTTCALNGKPAWFGLYQLTPGGTWLVARSGYGAILYTTAEYAKAGATYCALRDLDRHRETETHAHGG
jgi:hypothetical protein